MDWLYLIIAGLFECGWAVGLKYTHGWTRLWPSVWTVFAMIVSFWLLSIAMKTIPIGSAYAVWTGIGAVCVAIIGMLFLDESRAILRIISLLFIVVGIVGLKVISSSR